jgi:DNA-binding IscR family transcriptional regulator
MRLNTKCSIALHCLVFLSEFENKVKVTSTLLSKSTGCNAVIIRNIISSLQKEGIVSVAKGIGGTHLNREPDALTVWDVYHAIEPDGLEHFIGLHPNPSEQSPVGRKIRSILEKPYGEVGAAAQEAMKGITLQQLIDYYHRNDDDKFDYEP